MNRRVRPGMPKEQSPPRRLAIAARWPVGVALTSWRYMWRTTPLHRTEVEGSAADAAPPPLPANASRCDLQPAESGFGPFFHRRYRTRIRNSRGRRSASSVRSPTIPTVWRRLSSRRSASSAAIQERCGRVTSTCGSYGGAMGTVPVRGSAENGDYSGSPHSMGISRQARSSSEPVRRASMGLRNRAGRGSESRITDLLYDRLRMSKEVQLPCGRPRSSGSSSCRGGRMTGGIEIHTRRVASSTIDA